MIRTAFIILWVVLSTIVFGIIAIIISFFSRTGNPVHIIARIWAKGILIVSGIKVNINGFSNIDPSRSYIYMCNHQSNFDIPVLLGCLPVQFRWLAKAELFKIPIFGRAMRGAGYVAIDRFNRQSAFNSIAEVSQKMKNGVSVMIFPEGTRSKDGKIGSFKKGGFIMAVDSRVPIIPLVILGTRSIMEKGDMRINPGDVSMQIGQPVETATYTRETKDDLIKSVRGVICENFKRDEGN